MKKYGYVLDGEMEGWVYEGRDGEDGGVDSGRGWSPCVWRRAFWVFMVVSACVCVFMLSLLVCVCACTTVGGWVHVWASARGTRAIAHVEAAVVMATEHVVLCHKISTFPEFFRRTSPLLPSPPPSFFVFFSAMSCTLKVSLSLPLSPSVPPSYSLPLTPTAATTDHWTQPSGDK